MKDEDIVRMFGNGTTWAGYVRMIQRGEKYSIVKVCGHTWYYNSYHGHQYQATEYYITRNGHGIIGKNRDYKVLHAGRLTKDVKQKILKTLEQSNKRGRIV